MINLPIVNGDYVDEEEMISVSVETFQQMFDGMDTYDALINHPNCTPGWEDLLSKWKARGVIFN